MEYGPGRLRGCFFTPLRWKKTTSSQFTGLFGFGQVPVGEQGLFCVPRSTDWMRCVSGGLHPEEDPREGQKQKVKGQRTKGYSPRGERREQNSLFDAQGITNPFPFRLFPFSSQAYSSFRICRRMIFLCKPDRVMRSSSAVLLTLPRFRLKAVRMMSLS